MSKPESPAGLTPKQQRFVAEYLIDLNGTKAAIRAGYSARTANEQAVALLKHPVIAAAIDASKNARIERLDVDSDYVLQRLFAEANADLADLYNDAGDLKPVDEWPAIWRTGLVAGLDVEALYDGHGKDRVQVGLVKKIRLSDRLRRIELIGKHIKVNAFQDQVAVTDLDGISDRLERAHQRFAHEQATENAPVSRAAPEPASARAEASATPPPSPLKQPAKPYKPIVPAIPWPETNGPAITDYDPLND